ncbi:MAG: hypothetical protein CSB55_01820 [Candidatus Cloacimonadota bacterium]|nr:MAG: hypothetical protein CSB55_01820 [Candidatus Cloacimonadota bacterium]
MSENKSNHVPERTCCICGNKKYQKDLFRFVLSEHSEPVFDLKRRLFGRGYYVCSEPECLKKIDLWKKRLLKKKRKRKKS